MPKQYKRKLGARVYKNYIDDHIAEVVKMVLNKQLSLREASERSVYLLIYIKIVSYALNVLF